MQIVVRQRQCFHTLSGGLSLSKQRLATVGVEKNILMTRLMPLHQRHAILCAQAVLRSIRYVPDRVVVHERRCSCHVAALLARAASPTRINLQPTIRIDCDKIEASSGIALSLDGLQMPSPCSPFHRFGRWLIVSSPAAATAIESNRLCSQQRLPNHHVSFLGVLR